MPIRLFEERQRVIRRSSNQHAASAELAVLARSFATPFALVIPG
jgi:hypothetical protein